MHGVGARKGTTDKQLTKIQKIIYTMAEKMSKILLL